MPVLLHSLQKNPRSRVARAPALFLLPVLLSALLAACNTDATNPPGSPTATAPVISPTQGMASPSSTPAPPGKPITWPAFDGGGARSGINASETSITPTNVGTLARRWQVTLPAIVDSSPVLLPGVLTSGGVKALLFVTTLTGSLLAIDAATGQLVWRQDTQGPKITNSSPAIDPSGAFVYSYGLDGKVHKYAVGTGKEQVGKGFPAPITLMTQDEKGGTAINIGNGFLYMTTGGYIGDGGHYEGHVVAINLATGHETVFNSLCANITTLLDNVPGDPNYCQNVQSGIWARAGAVIDPLTGNVFVTTGNGPYTANAGGFDYGDSVIELSPDLTKVIDSYTPMNYAALGSSDIDLGSSEPVMLPQQANSLTPSMAVQIGKDGIVRLLNRQNLSGQGGPGHVGGELQAVALPQGCSVFSQPIAWNDAQGVTWVFVANGCGFSAFRVSTDSSGHSSLKIDYLLTDSGSSPFIADGILFLQEPNVIKALDPTTGTTLWSSSDPSAGGSIGDLHWQSPIVVNGMLYVPDQSGQLTAYGLG